MKHKLYLARFALIVLAYILAIRIGELISFDTFALSYPYDLDYGEGIVWQQMRNIVAGTAYRPLGVFPAIVYHYPPLYHLTTAGLAQLTGMDQLYAGRTVSIISLGAMLSAVSLLSFRLAPLSDNIAVRLTYVLLATACLASGYTITLWSGIMRVDMLSSALSILGLLSASYGFKRSWPLLLAAIVFVGAFYVKQTSLVMPVAVFFTLLIVQPRKALWFLIFCIALGLPPLVHLIVQTKGEFLHHIIFYNLNRLDLGLWILPARLLLMHIGLVALALIGIHLVLKERLDISKAGLLARIKRDEMRSILLLICLAFLFKTLSLLTMLKSGSSDNYMIDWLSMAALFASLALRPLVRLAFNAGGQPSLLLVLIVLLLLPINLMQLPDFASKDADLRREEDAKGRIVAMIHNSSKPVISDDMVLLIRAGQPVLWEPAIIAELTSAGFYDQRAFIEMIRRRDFGFIISRGRRGDTIYDRRYDIPIASEIAAAYPRVVRQDGLFIHLP